MDLICRLQVPLNISCTNLTMKMRLYIHHMSHLTALWKTKGLSEPN